MPISPMPTKLLTPYEARAQLWAAMGAISPRTERIATEQALGRVLAMTVHSGEDMPAFDRSAVDGYAVIASDTAGAADHAPAILSLIGEAAMGQPAHITLQPGQALLVHTGSMLPPNADAVVMLEHAQPSHPNNRKAGNAISPDSIRLTQSITAGQNVIQRGADLRIGDTVLRSGHILRPPDIGGLMALGLTEIAVAAQLRVGVISTGDEVVPPTAQPAIGQVRDVNTYALSAAVQQVGGIPVCYGIVPDDLPQLRRVAQQAKAECDVVVLSAGSSVSLRDMSARVIAELGQPGLLAQGLNVRPGKPTLVALCDGVAVFGLPGNPAPALIMFEVLVRPTIEHLQGVSHSSGFSPATRQATLMRNIASVGGREDYVPVTLAQTADGTWQATPLIGKSSFIFSLMQAQGLVKVPTEVNELRAGQTVTVIMQQ